MKKSHAEIQSNYIPNRSAVRALVEELEDALLPTEQVSSETQQQRIDDLARKIASLTHGFSTTHNVETTTMIKDSTSSLNHVCQALTLDIEAALRGDPAALSDQYVIASYPGPLAIAVYRVAHALHLMGITILPRQMTEVAHSRTGIDIHPGASIGAGFFIDHGTGVVIGETTIIGQNVRLYQGVTLGAGTDPMKAGRTKRHPTLEDDVICYANSSILGPVTIGRGARIGAGATVFDDVPADTTVLMPKPELITRVRSTSKKT
jgi:serine O-acetyltransferase